MFVKWRKQFSLLCVCAFVFSVGGLAFAKPKSDLVKQEPGFYYGFGEGQTKEDAEFAAKKDLVENSLTASVRLQKPSASQIFVSADAVKERIENIKAFRDEKPFNANKTGTKVTFRLKIAEWDKMEKTYAEVLRNSLAADYQKLLGTGSVAEKLDIASKIMKALAERGETDLLTLNDGETELYSQKVESACSSAIKTISLNIGSADGIINPDAKIAVSASDANGKPIANLSLKILWEDSYMPVTSDDGELPEVVTVVKTDKSGKAAAEYPSAPEFRNKIVSLTVSTAMSASDYATKSMRKLDAASSVDAHFFCVDDVNEMFKTVNVEGGDFEAGAVAQDKRATKREELRKVTVEPFAMSVTPVTNLQYAAYLYLTRSESYPEYFENSDYNNVNQPVIGISAEDAEAYAAWLSEQTGSVFRLPTDDEWECAARAGEKVVYPWGDTDPAKAKAANCKGNGKFKGPSPVGAFAGGANSLGLVDMSGNVWEWTSSVRNGDADSGLRTVKGGSWMDGPADLRISNFKNIDSAAGYPDVGFRLVKEGAAL